jgi:competence protein ComEC
LSGSLGRVWLVAAAVAGGTVHGCAHEAPRPLVMGAIAALGAVAGLRRSGTARAAGLAAVAFSLGSVGSSPRCDATTALEVMARRLPACWVRASVLEPAGGLGTLATIHQLGCAGYPPVESPGVAVMDGTVAHPGVAFAGRGRLVPLGTDVFDRARRRAGAHASLELVRSTTTPPRGLHALAFAIRRSLVRAVGDLDPRRAGLLRGLAVGDVTAIDDDTEVALRRAGLSHLLAVSGSNVAIVLGAVGATTAFLGARLRMAGAAGALGLYVLIVGPDPSVLRAAAMGAIGLAALAVGSRAEPLQALGLALTALLALRPGLVFAVGLHLSVAATAGIVVWGPPLSRRWSRRLPHAAAVGLAATVAAQAAVAPILVMTFGELSIAGLPANALALVAVPPATICALAAGVAGALYPPGGEVLARAAEPFAAWILWVGDTFGRAGWATASLPSWSGAAMGIAAAIGVAVALRSASPGGRDWVGGSAEESRTVLR